MKTTFSNPSLSRWLALAAVTLVLTACGSDNNVKPSTSQAQAMASAAAESPPVITVQPLSTSVSAGGVATFTVAVTGDALNYQWQRNGEPLPKAVGPSYTTSAASTTASGSQYSVLITNSHGQVTSAPATLTVTEAMFSN